MHGAWRFRKVGKQAWRQRSQCRPLDFRKHPAHLLARGAVQPRVGHRAFPLAQVQVLFGQAAELAPRQRVVLRILHARLDLALVPGHRRARGQHHRAVVPAELGHLRVELGLIPVRPGDDGPQVVHDQRARHPAEVAERIFQTPDELLGRLPPHHFAVSLARMREHDPEQMGPSPPGMPDHPRALPEVHLRLRARLHLHAHEGHRLGRAPLSRKPFDRLIAAGEAVRADEFLIDPLRGPPQFQPRLDLLLPRGTETLPARPGAEGRNGRFCSRQDGRPGGRNGGF